MSAARVTRLLVTSEVKRRPGRFLLTMLAVAVGVAGFVALRAGTRAAVSSSAAAVEAVAGRAALQILAAGTPGGALPAGTLERARETPGVTAALPSVDAPTLPVEEVEGWVLPLFPGEETGLRIIGALLDEEVRSGRVVLVAGELPGRPSGKAPFPVVVGASWARDHDVAVGATLTLTAARGETTVVVKGLAAPEGFGNRQGGDVVIGWLSDVQEGFSVAGIEEVSLVLRDDSEAISIARALEQALGPSVVVTAPATRGQHIANRLKSLEAGMLLTSSLSLFLCAFAVVAIFGTAAAERRRDVGLLRSLGLSPLQAASPIAVEAAMAGLTGAVVGALLGTPAARVVAATLLRGAGGAAYPVPTSLVDLGAGALLGFITALVAGTVPAILAAREPPLDAVRAMSAAARPPPWWVALLGVVVALAGAASLVAWPPGSVPPEVSYAGVLGVLGGSVAFLPLVAWIVGRVHLANARWLGLRGLAWRPMRAGMAAGAVLGAVGVVGGVSALGSSLHDEMEQWASRAMSFDLVVRRTSGITAEDVERWRAISGVAYVAAVDVRPIFVEGPNGAAVAVSAVGLDDELGRRQLATPSGQAAATLAPGEVLTTSVLAAQLGWKTGGDIVVRSSEGPRRLKIGGEVVDYTSNGYVVFLRRETLASLFSSPLPRSDLAVVNVIEGASVGDVARALEQLPGVRAETRDQVRARAWQRVEESLGALDALGWTAGLIGFLAISATLARATLERRGQLAALRAIGATPGQVRQLVVVEALALALLGAVPGVVLAALFAFVFTRSAGALGLDLAMDMPWEAIAAAIVSSMCAAVLAAMGPVRRALAVAPAEALGES